MTFPIIATLYSQIVHHNIRNLSFQQCFFNCIRDKWSIIIGIRSNNRWCFWCIAFPFPFSFLCCWCLRCCQSLWSSTCSCCCQSLWSSTRSCCCQSLQSSTCSCCCQSLWSSTHSCCCQSHIIPLLFLWFLNRFLIYFSFLI